MYIFILFKLLFAQCVYREEEEKNLQSEEHLEL